MSGAATIPDAWKEWLLQNRDRGCDPEGLMQRALDRVERVVKLGGESQLAPVQQRSGRVRGDAMRSGSIAHE